MFGNVAAMTSVDSRRPGRPRSEVARTAILSATLELAAAHGPQGLRMDAIAKRAGVSKETLYRWWRSKTEVMLEALAEQGQATIPLPDTGSLAGDLRAFLRDTVASADSTTQRLLRALASEAAANAEFARLVRARFIDRRRAALSTLLNRAVARRELTRADAKIAIDLIYGSLWYRLIFDVAPLDRKWADAVVRVIAPAPPSEPGAR
jgi:AcrR family transcriptional regulator